MKKIWTTIALASLLAVGLAVWGFLIEPSFLKENRQEFQWNSGNLRVAFFSDLHMGAPHIDSKYVDGLVSRINAFSPDLVLIGGDLVIDGVIGGNKTSIEVIASKFALLKSKLGVFAVLGNHDWWNDGDHIAKVLQNNGIQVLENESIELKTSTGSFNLVGVGDHSTGHAKVNNALVVENNALEKLLFMHDPAALLEIKSEYSLALAGHMHGGQVFIPGIGALITPGAAPKDWSKGWKKWKGGKLFVSAGVGTSILPVRMNATPEFVILDLNSGKGGH